MYMCVGFRVEAAQKFEHCSTRSTRSTPAVIECMVINMFVYIYIYVYTYIHIHIHIYIYLQGLGLRRWNRLSICTLRLIWDAYD